jgi:ABC-2 type transport system ATP-binding protein
VAADAVVVDDVAVAFGSTHALDGVDLRVTPGTTLGVLGHNGAGKTTLIRVLTTLIRPDRGRVWIDGIDALAQPGEVRRRIGVTGQYAGLDDFLTTVENLELVGRLAGLRTAARGRAGDLVERFDLRAVASRRVGELSGGSRRRVDLAASLVASPTVLFLDEPTTGLDPTARQALWAVVAELTAAGTTVLLTTQYLEEADRLADQVVVLDHGRIAGHGTPAELKALIGGKVVRATIPAHSVDTLPQRPDATTTVAGDRVEVLFTLADAATAAALVSHLATDTAAIIDLDVASPSLDDVFFHLATTGAPT